MRGAMPALRNARPVARSTAGFRLQRGARLSGLRYPSMGYQEPVSLEFYTERAIGSSLGSDLGRRKRRKRRKGKNPDCMQVGIDERLAKRARRTKGSAVAASGLTAAASAALPIAPPWGAIAAGVLAAVAAGLAVGNKLRGRGDMALSGDDRAIAGYMRRAAKWSAKKRKRKAIKHNRILKRVLSRKRRQCAGRRGRKGPTNRVLVHEAKLKLKLGALVALEVEARRNPHEPLIEGEVDTTPAVTKNDPAANADSLLDDVDPVEFSIIDMRYRVGGVPAPLLLAGGLLGFGLVTVMLLSGSPRRTNPRRYRRAA